MRVGWSKHFSKWTEKLLEYDKFFIVEENQTCQTFNAFYSPYRNVPSSRHSRQPKSVYKTLVKFSIWVCRQSKFLFLLFNYILGRLIVLAIRAQTGFTVTYTISRKIWVSEIANRLFLAIIITNIKTVGRFFFLWPVRVIKLIHCTVVCCGEGREFEQIKSVVKQ